MHDAHVFPSALNPKTTFRRIGLLVALLFLFVAAGAANAQQTASQPPDAVALKNQVSQKLAAAQQEFSRAADVTAPAPVGTTADELGEQKRLLRVLVRSYERELAALTALEDLHRSVAESDNQIDELKAFEGPPPYPVDAIDALWDRIRAIASDRRALEVEESLVESYVKEYKNKVDKAAEDLRKANERLEGITDPDRLVRQRWLRDLADLRKRVAEAALTAFETERRLTDEKLAANTRRSERLEKRLAQVAAQSPLSEADRDAKLAQIADAREGLRRSRDKAEREDESGREELNKARDQLDKLRQSIGEAAPSDEQSAKLAALQQLVNTRKAQSETATVALEVLKLREDTLSAKQTIWGERFTAAHTSDVDELDRTARSLDAGLDKAAQWRTYFQAKLDHARTLSSDWEKELRDWTAKNGDRRLANEVMKAYSKREDLYRSAVVAIDEVERLLERLRGEVDERRGHVSWGERAASLFKDLREAAESLWQYELFTAEDTITVDGQQVTGKRSITVSKLVSVILILTLGIWAARFLARRAYHFMRARFHVEQSNALLVHRTVVVLLVGFLVIVALNLVKIPFTVFAFLGGALAIAVGFGAQNLINNFVSGLILLIERPIKVGDIVDIEGARGRVVKIGGRCSQVRLWEGIDMLVPNSSLLEKNVTNWTLTDENLRFVIQVGVAYGSPTQETADLIHRAATEHALVLKDPAPLVIFDDFGDSALVFSLYFWVRMLEGIDPRVVRSDIRHRIDALLREAGITIAFPQRDVHVDAADALRVELVDRAGGHPAGG
jgi:potassium efflux system protein